MTKLGLSQKVHICPKVPKMGSIIGRRIDYNGVEALRGQRHIPCKYLPKYPPPGINHQPGLSIPDVELIPLELQPTLSMSRRKAREAYLIDRGKTLSSQTV